MISCICNESFEEEILVLKSIYGDDSNLKDDKVLVSLLDHNCTLLFTIDLATYPASPLSIDIKCSYKENFKRQLENEILSITARGGN